MGDVSTVGDLFRLSLSQFGTDVPARVLAESLSSAIDEVAIERSDELLSEIETAAAEREKMLAHHRSHVRDVWGPALDRMLMCWVGFTELGVELAASYEPAELQIALQGLLGRAALGLHEAFSLISTGLPDAATGRTRMLHELAVVSKVLVRFGQSDGDSTLAARWIARGDIDRARLMRSDAAAGWVIDSDLSDEILVLEKEAIANFGPEIKETYGWAAQLVPKKQPRQINFHDLREVVGAGQDKPFFDRGNHSVHAGALGIERTLVVGHSTAQLVGPTDVGIDGPAIAALVALDEIVLTVAWESVDPRLSMLEAASVFRKLIIDAVEQFEQVGASGAGDKLNGA